MGASKNSILSTIKENPIQKDTKKIACSKGHDISLYNRADGRCGRCHTLKNVKYRSTNKGMIAKHKYESKRRRNRARQLYLYLWHVRGRIEVKKRKILEIEKELMNDKENANRNRASADY